MHSKDTVGDAFATSLVVITSSTCFSFWDAFVPGWHVPFAYFLRINKTLPFFLPPPSAFTLPPYLRRASPRYPTPESRASSGDAVVQKMEQTLVALREELEVEVQAMSKSRSIEDSAALMAKEAEVSKV